MSRWISVSCAVLLGMALGESKAWSDEQAAPAAPEIVWQLSDGVQAPESVYFEPESSLVFVSQIGGGGATAKDGDGWISKLSTDGKFIENHWVTGLDAPKGMRSHRGTLWVTDITRLVGIAIAEGKITTSVEVEGARFLNDLAVGPDGTVYISDMSTNRIHAYRDGEVTLFAEGETLEHPNGLLVQGDRLLVAAWGPGLRDDFSTERPGRLLAIDLATQKRTAISPDPVGHLDGLESDGQRGYLVTDFIAGTIIRISSDGAPRTLATRAQGTADHAFLADRGLLILPEMLENKITAIDLNALLEGD